mmetsp:Transcript_24990/g.42543  ORF Transcript_24990/g.42543 Transcript_24990/m.42543 type:complete len:198 (-) Transcript_24990:106-699(-)
MKAGVPLVAFMSGLHKSRRRATPSSSYHFPTGSSTTFQGRNILCMAPSTDSEILNSNDIVTGVAIAFGLVLTVLWLQGEREQQQQNAMRFREQFEDTELKLDTNGTIVFDADSWEDIMSQPENYILYNTKLRKRQLEKKPQFTTKTEKRWAVLALLSLFLPIFSAELYLALSRQFLCENNALGHFIWAQELCKPHDY